MVPLGNNGSEIGSHRKCSEVIGNHRRSSAIGRCRSIKKGHLSYYTVVKRELICVNEEVKYQKEEKGGGKKGESNLQPWDVGKEGSPY